ncbi:ATP-grasp fold amidoligase family protein [Butyrivibrio fibrisolvens]|uniref:ATP-grasp fold amidoligase family protein n=1 Tax=Butyrivibrio fibrisolvens TaxID=831 RepID=UPI0020BE52E0|nr:ATP-grasp fold amidoligase family protein [Butyrivibrio fibrisolvens]
MKKRVFDIIKHIFNYMGFEITRKKCVQKSNKLPFSQTIYVPRWRLKNYYALKEFGEPIKRWFIEQKYYYCLGEFPDLDNPKTFNEKIHWLNLHYHNPLITKCCDKYEMKTYVKERIGEGYTIDVIKKYDSPSEISFAELPDKFAIKVNWGDGPEFSEVVENKAAANEARIKAKMSNAIQPWNNLFYSHFFWGYQNVNPCIFVEKYIEHGSEDIVDYKIHCFNGTPKIVLVCENRTAAKMNKTFLDMEWNVLPCYREDGEVNPNVIKPNNFDEMIDVAKKLSAPFPFVRIDLYNNNSRICVGEMTFHPGCGFEKFIPDEWNRIVGDMLVLPEI